jgi:hypothetical protein
VLVKWQLIVLCSVGKVAIDREIRKRRVQRTTQKEQSHCIRSNREENTNERDKITRTTYEDDCGDLQHRQRGHFEENDCVGYQCNHNVDDGGEVPKTVRLRSVVGGVVVTDGTEL